MSVRLPLSRLFPGVAAAALLAAVLSPAAIAGPPCVADGCTTGPGACAPPTRYACRVKVGHEPIERDCAVIETDVICIPPITTSPLCCLKNLLCGKKDCGTKNRGCGVDGCTTAGCDGAACGARGCVPKKPSGWFAKLTNHGCGCGGGLRCVNTLDVHEYECGTRCVCEWSAVPVGGCGQAPCESAVGQVPAMQVYPAPAAPRYDQRPVGGDAVPPAPVPAPPATTFDLPSLIDAPPASAE
ncbi:hypothetical protein [Alienimonas chondri]|uniref:Uncharacterized protein n=1 Tax=Alienimonas chondri TaxID=2681879 RepID=A0ABX1VA33_9PLAN|nr:hypothetical protein [Alienimonas chondri]NNJ24855.1 hypothetical protein [Alienimonas chondri]